MHSRSGFMYDWAIYIRMSPLWHKLEAVSHHTLVHMAWRMIV